MIIVNKNYKKNCDHRFRTASVYALFPNGKKIVVLDDLEYTKTESPPESNHFFSRVIFDPSKKFEQNLFMIF